MATLRKLIESVLERDALDGDVMTDSEPTASAQPNRPSTPPDRPKEETARLGDAIYQREIRAQVEADHDGEVVAIDVESGAWAIGDNVIAATDRLWIKHPAAHDIWCLRVGHRALHHFGGRPLRRAG